MGIESGRNPWIDDDNNNNKSEGTPSSWLYMLYTILAPFGVAFLVMLAIGVWNAFFEPEEARQTKPTTVSYNITIPGNIPGASTTEGDDDATRRTKSLPLVRSPASTELKSNSDSRESGQKLDSNANPNTLYSRNAGEKSQSEGGMGRYYK